MYDERQILHRTDMIDDCYISDYEAEILERSNVIRANARNMMEYVEQQQQLLISMHNKEEVVECKQ
jgi:hypothetical protein